MKDKKSLRSRDGESDRIRVYVRVRPRTLEESKRQEDLGVESDKFEVSLYDARERRYRFDSIFPSQATNKEVFNTVGKPLLDAVFSGFNGTLMAYGQTGTGKTHTLMSKEGICTCVVEKLFKRINLDKYHDYKVCMSYLQIYQEKIYDLLNANSKLELVLREDPKKGVYVENLSEYVVRDTAEVLSLLKLGKKKLIFAETRMNRVSSRSHSVCQITVERTRSKGTKAAAGGNTAIELIIDNPETRFSSEGNLLSPSSAATPPSRKTVRSTGSLDRLSEETKTRSTPLKVPSGKQQSFIPRRTSTPASKRSLSRNNEHRHSFHLSSLPEMSVTPVRPNRWSIGDVTGSFMGSGESLPESITPSASQGSDLQFSMDSELESGTESEGWPSAPSSPDIPEYGFGEDDDDDESFLEEIRIRDDVLITGRINICDLAGSERIKKAGVEGERLSELQHVNLSLLELGNTIQALSEGKRTHIPYRNSSLTRLLQDSLGGNCKTSFVMCISPLLRDLNETRCTLDFGQRALKITSTAYVNVEIDYRKLSEDLRKRIENQELEIKAQKDNFEKQSHAIKTDSELKLAEVQALLEAERDRYRIEIENLRREKENLAKTLFDERSQRRVLEGMHHASLEAAVLIERQKITSNEEREKERLQSALDEERRRSWTIEQRTKEEYEKALEDEKKRAQLLKQLERERLEKSLEEEKQRISELQERLVKSPSHERYTQTIKMFDEPDFPRMPPGTNQTETLYNVLLAEIMSLQLLYQMQDLSRACSADDPQSRDSGCADYEDEVIHSVSSSVLEKGGLLLNNLRGRQRGSSRFSLTSTDSLRELYLLQFPPSPKLSRASQKTESVPIIPLKSSLSELHSDSDKSYLSGDSDGPRGQEGTSSSSMESFLEDELLSPRRRKQPSDSGCSSQHSDSDHSPGASKRSQPIDIAGRSRAHSNPVQRLDMNTCVPLAEEEDEDLDLAEPDEIQTVKRKVVHLENDLCRLKTELDSETVNFFSEVFRVEVPFLREGELSRVMRRLFEGVKEKLLYRICGGQGSSFEEAEDDLELTPPLLEEAVNLLLVNKTVMSCILVLQNRRDTERNHGSTTTDLPTVIHVPLKVDQQTQTDPEPIRSLRRRIRKDAGVVTDPPIKIRLSDKECQTSVQDILDRIPEVNSAPKDEFLEAIPNSEPWYDLSDSNVDRASDDSIPLLSREPDGASSEDEPAVTEENQEDVTTRRDDVMPSSDNEDLKDTKGKKKKKQRLFACLSPPRLSFRKKSERANQSKTDTTKLVVIEI